jgi:hypothetical protein
LLLDLREGLGAGGVVLFQVLQGDGNLFGVGRREFRDQFILTFLGSRGCYCGGQQCREHRSDEGAFEHFVHNSFLNLVAGCHDCHPFGPAVRFPILAAPSAVSPVTAG